MAWTETEISQFQIDNNKALAEVNATLRPDEGLSGKVGIFCQGQLGDTATVMAALKYRREIFGDRNIVWYINSPNCDILRYAPISEVRPWPWPGNGLPKEHHGDLYPVLADANNRLNLAKAKEYELTHDLDDGWFPATWQVAVPKRHGVDYPNVSRKVFGIPDSYEWHPVLNWSDEERAAVRDVVEKLPKGRNNVLLETYCGSGQSKYWNEQTTMDVMRLCRVILGGCNFIFASHKHKGGENNVGISNELFFDDEGCISVGQFTVRQCALFNDYCSVMIGMSSGISVSTSAWGLKPVVKIQYCGSRVCSTVPLSNGEIHLVTTDGKNRDIANEDFFNTIKSVLEGLKNG